MRFITDYKELEGNPNISLMDHISETAIPEKGAVLEYLKNGQDDGVRCTTIFDYVKNEGTGETVFLYTDGDFYWTGEEIYLFEHYNLELNPEFIQKVIA